MDSQLMLLSMVSASGGEFDIIDKNHPRSPEVVWYDDAASYAKQHQTHDFLLESVICFLYSKMM